MTESAIVRQILDYLTAERIFAFRLNTSATKIGNRFFRAHSLGKGAADILAFPKYPPLPEKRDSHGNLVILGYDPPAFPVWIECKTSTGKQSPEQKSFQEHVESLGHRYIIASSVDHVSWLWEASKR